VRQKANAASFRALVGSGKVGGVEMSEWTLDMIAEPVIPSWTTHGHAGQNGSELQRAIIKGFSEFGDPVWAGSHKEFTFEKTFTFKEHGEFFRGALTMAGLRYAGDFYELLQRYWTIKVTIVKAPKPEGEV
jgi:hypothetical protein